MNVLGCAAMKVIEAHIISVAEPELPGAATVGWLWTCINSALFKSSTLKIVISGAVAAAAWNVFFCLEPDPEPTQVEWSRSRLRDLGHLVPEASNQVAAPQF